MGNRPARQCLYGRTYPDAAAAALRRQQLASGLVSQPVRLADTYQPALLLRLAGERTRRLWAPGSAILARWEAAGVVLRLHARHELPSIFVN